MNLKLIMKKKTNVRDVVSNNNEKDKKEDENGWSLRFRRKGRSENEKEKNSLRKID